MSSAADKPLSRLSTTLLRLRRRESARELAQTLWVVADQAVVSLASFATTVVVGRVCGSEELGIYVLATTTFWLLAGIPNALTWTPFTSRAPRMSSGRRAGYCGSVTIHTVLLTSVLAAVLVIAGLLPSSWFGQSGWFSMMCFALVPFTLMMTLREHVRRICMAQIAVRELLTFDAPIAVAQLLLLVWLARRGWLTANTALVAVAAACLISFVWMISHRSDFEFRRRRAAVHWSYNLQFGRWLLAISIAWLLSDSLYRWIVGWQYGLDGLGRFASAQAVVLFINPLLLTATNFGRALSANRFAVGGMRDLRRLTIQATVLVTLVGGIAFLALAAVGGPLVRLIFGAQYGGLGGIVATLCLGMLVRVAGVPIDASLAALREGRAMFAAIVVQLAVVILAGIPLIAHCGLNGVGYTMVLAYGATTLIQWYWFLQCDRARHLSNGTGSSLLGLN
ncbi:MAG TPA: lipopolysaccharide biosynthesis protein [Lacipirellulaceae bacterium]|nr:lipopolysaccharide biosynthesis protein [Lacipirellulaceae bacterium]